MRKGALEAEWDLRELAGDPMQPTRLRRPKGGLPSRRPRGAAFAERVVLPSNDSRPLVAVRQAAVH